MGTVPTHPLGNLPTCKLVNLPTAPYGRAARQLGSYQVGKFVGLQVAGQKKALQEKCLEQQWDSILALPHGSKWKITDRAGQKGPSGICI